MFTEILSASVSMMVPIFISFIAAIITFILWGIHRNQYWKNLNVPYIPSTPFIGAFKDSMLGRASIYDVTKRIYNDPRVKNLPYYGLFMFHKPVLFITEPELIKRIMVKDYQHFQNRHTASHPKADPIGYYNLMMLRNPQWKQLRVKLSPFFASGKLKSMYYLMDNINKTLVKYIETCVVSKKQPEIELKEIMACYTTDVIASCAFGVEANSIENPNGDFRRVGREIFNFTFRRGCEMPAFFMCPETVPIFKFQLFSSSGSEWIKKMFNYVLALREKSGEKRNDFIDSLIELKKADHGKTQQKNGELVFKDDVLTAQAAVFFAAGFETSASTMSFAIYELVKQPELQDRLRRDIREALKTTNGEVTYDLVMNSLPYLTQVVNEVMRMYPVLAYLDRKCEMTDGSDGYSLEPYGDFKIPNKMPVMIPLYGIQLDERFFPNPTKFDPERFSVENKDNIIAGTFIPFGLGNHICIGERFGLLQIKIGLCNIFKEFRAVANDRTPKTIELTQRAIIMQSRLPLYVDFIKDPLLASN